MLLADLRCEENAGNLHPDRQMVETTSQTVIGHQPEIAVSMVP